MMGVEWIANLLASHFSEINSMTTKRIVWTDANGDVCVTTPSPEAMTALTGVGGKLRPDHIEKQSAAYVAAGMSSESALKLATGYAHGGLSEEDALDLIWQRTLADQEKRGNNPVNVANLEADSLPYFGSFGRGAWTQDGASAPTFDMEKARIIKTNQIRPERNKRLADLDVTYLRADEAGDTATKEKIAVQKQEMRDLPATIQSDLNALNTPEELESFTPTWPSSD
jgi:hypothetical protein